MYVADLAGSEPVPGLCGFSSVWPRLPRRSTSGVRGGLVVYFFSGSILARADICVEISAPSAPSCQLSYDEYIGFTLSENETAWKLTGLQLVC